MSRRRHLRLRAASGRCGRAVEIPPSGAQLCDAPGNLVARRQRGAPGEELSVDVIQPRIEAVWDESIALDLQDVALVDRPAVVFLSSCRARGIALQHCPAYVREWIAGSRSARDVRTSRHASTGRGKPAKRRAPETEGPGRRRRPMKNTADVSAAPEAWRVNVSRSKQSGPQPGRADTRAQRYEALSRLSTALASLTTEHLARSLADVLRPALDFDLLDVVV